MSLAQNWLIGSHDFKIRDGRPFGDNTEMAKRAEQGQNPWDEGCRVETFVDGLSTMNSIRDDLARVIEDAKSAGNNYGDFRGYVYISGWRISPNRDMSTNFSPRTNDTDDTLWYFIEKLMAAGVRVRILAWMPLEFTKHFDYGPHQNMHILSALMMRKLNQSLMRNVNPQQLPEMGVVFLDGRTPDDVQRWVASHHQKFMVIRGITTNIAYCGGIDLTYTRRDAPQYNGDWQSGIDIPENTANLVNPPPSDGFKSKTQASDLKYHDVFKSTQQIWHDQHLRLEGSIVSTIENLFKYRWEDHCDKIIVALYPGESTIPHGSKKIKLGRNQLISSSETAFEFISSKKLYRVKPLPDPSPSPAVGQSIIQPWQTIPHRVKERKNMYNYPGVPRYLRGEFSVMAGLQKSCKQAKQLIFIVDQYFWNIPYARLLAQQLKANDSLRIIIILPPHSDMKPDGIGGVIARRQHAYRRDALSILDNAASDRFAVFSTWNKPNTSGNGSKGIYTHAKVQLFDNILLLCGSANVNRRSFSADTELSCAVLDTTVILNHYNKLWQYYFGISMPGFNFGNNQWGKQFFNEFLNSTTSTNSMLTPDLWKPDNVTLPGGQARENDYAIIRGDFAIDPSSLPSKVERKVKDGNSYRPARLDDIVSRIENDSANWRFLSDYERWFTDVPPP